MILQKPLRHKGLSPYCVSGCLCICLLVSGMSVGESIGGR
jgi:hypothetical protein